MTWRVFLWLAAVSTIQAQDKPAERFQYFYDQRRFPHAQIPEGARLKAVQALDQREAAIRAGKSPARRAGADNPWKLIGPQPINFSSGGFITSGRITAIAADPRGNDTVYAGAADGGVWKTTDGGTTWMPLT